MTRLMPGGSLAKRRAKVNEVAATRGPGAATTRAHHEPAKEIWSPRELSSIIVRPSNLGSVRLAAVELLELRLRLKVAGRQIDGLLRLPIPGTSLIQGGR